MNRRRLLKLLSAGGLSGLSGCGSISRRASNTTSQQSSPSPVDSSSKSPTEKPTETEIETTDESWEIDPVEHGKLIGAHYYPWHTGRTPDSRITHAPVTPELGKYDSEDTEVINQHIKWALEHGINWFSASWWGRHSKTDQTLRYSFPKAELGNKIDISILYETKGRLSPNSRGYDFDIEQNREVLARDMQYLEETYFDRDNYLRIDGRPVVYFYSAMLFGGDIAGAFQEVRSSLNSDPYLIADVLEWGRNIIYEDWMKEFDAVSVYNIYNPEVVASGGFDAFLEYADSRSLNWHLKADNAGLDFIPDIIPGYDDSEIRNNPVLPRSPENFSDICDMGIQYIDSDIDAVLITSFNEWPEYTAVEPTNEYGTTYLQVIREHLVDSEPNYVNKDQYAKFGLDFNKTVVPEGGDSRALSLLLGSIEFFDDDRELIGTYDIGVKGEEPIFVEGAFKRESNEDTDPSTWRWLGGPTSKSLMYLDSGLSPASSATLRGMPMIDNEIEADVYFKDQKTDHIQLGKREANEYSVSLSL